jgi:hypothetical protein
MAFVGSVASGAFPQRSYLWFVPAALLAKDAMGKFRVNYDSGA